MIKAQRTALEAWANTYRDNPATLSSSPKHALAITIHDYMKHGKWKTSNEIASELNEKLHSVRTVIGVIAVCWGYESHRKKGYRRLN